ncbi:hypothetical protein DRJ17_03330 [Candidatus Woesearchaeota archaeon]|nr:MAG: hypothetical protein DRJ17_03330 [Candidatus Woesearchaeota archaeon]
MKFLAITVSGFEDICQKELKEFGAKKTNIKTGCVIFELNKSKIVSLIDLGQSFSKIIEIWHTDKFTSLSSFRTIKNIRINIKPTKTFLVRCQKIESKYSSHEIEACVGENIIKNLTKTGFKPKVSTLNPDIHVFTYVTKSEFFLGQDLTIRDLSKRKYRVFVHPASFRGHIAYCLLRFSGFKPGKRLLDPNCRDGIIPIEAALFSKGKSKKSTIEATDPFIKNILIAKKNAKIANVKINFSKQDFDWLETHYESNYFDFIVTALPSPTKYNQKRIKESYKTLFESVSEILKQNGKVAILVRKPELLKQQTKNRFKLIEERNIYVGKERFVALLAKKI